MFQPFEPPLPGPSDSGRLAFFLLPIVPNSIPLLGWHCRWCRSPLLQCLNEMTNRPALAVACTNCDRGFGEHPEMFRQRRGL